MNVYKRIGGMVTASATLWLAWLDPNQAAVCKKNAAEVVAEAGRTT